MGIPFYFKSLISRFPDIINTSHTKCNRLFLDFNCIIHMSASKLLHHIKDPTQFYEIVIETSIAYIDVILSVAPPSTLLYIAVDGACPRAKLQQQRKRRYMSVWRTNELEKLGVQTPKIWDSNVVTPGTDFMQMFDERITKYVTHVQSKTPFEIIVSTSSAFGEGEHKIFDHISKNPQSGVDVVYGLDADLILLSLLQDRDIRLLRETPEFNVPGVSKKSHFLYLDISKLKQRLVCEYLNNDSNRVKDYVVFCGLLGNDFIPPLSFLKIKSNGIELLLKIYSSVVEGTGRYLINKDELDWQVMTNTLEKLAAIEDDSFAEVSEAYYNKHPYKDCSIETYLDNYPIVNKYPRKINVEFSNWRKAYYKEMFQSDKEVVKAACQKYFEGICWVVEYYITKHHNVGWYYPFHYSPTCADLYNHVLSCENVSNASQTTRHDHETHKQYHDIISKPSMQLLMVMPPTAASLIPNLSLRSIVSDIKNKCVQFYPTQFYITTYLKTCLWECSAILPDINIEHIFCAYNKINQTV